MGFLEMLIFFVIIICNLTEVKKWLWPQTLAFVSLFSAARGQKRMQRRLCIFPGGWCISCSFWCNACLPNSNIWYPDKDRPVVWSCCSSLWCLTLKWRWMIDVCLRCWLCFYKGEKKHTQKHLARREGFVAALSRLQTLLLCPLLFPPSLFLLWEIMWLFDLRRDEWQWFSKSSPVSITLGVKYQLRVCTRESVRECARPVSPITPLGSVTRWQRALIFQFYHTPLSRLSPRLALFLITFFFLPSQRPVQHPRLQIRSNTCLKGAVTAEGDGCKRTAKEQRGMRGFRQGNNKWGKKGKQGEVKMGRTGIVCGAPGAGVRTVSLTQGQMQGRRGVGWSHIKRKKVVSKRTWKPHQVSLC